METRLQYWAGQPLRQSPPGGPSAGPGLLEGSEVSTPGRVPAASSQMHSLQSHHWGAAQPGAGGWPSWTQPPEAKSWTPVHTTEHGTRLSAPALATLATQCVPHPTASTGQAAPSSAGPGTSILNGFPLLCSPSSLLAVLASSHPASPRVPASKAHLQGHLLLEPTWLSSARTLWVTPEHSCSFCSLSAPSGLRIRHRPWLILSGTQGSARSVGPAGTKLQAAGLLRPEPRTRSNIHAPCTRGSDGQACTCPARAGCQEGTPRDYQVQRRGAAGWLTSEAPPESNAP